MDETTIEKLKHSIGLDCESKIYHRKGKAYYKAYRNYWCACFPEDDFEKLCENGFMEKCESDTLIYYRLTAAGLKMFGAQININIKV